MGSSYFALIIGLGMMLVQPLPAQTLTFVRHYSNAFPIADVTGDTLDSTGVYIAGGLRKTQSIPNYNLDAYVRKTDVTGQELWVRQLGGAATITGVAAASGGVYIAGQTEWNIDAQAYYSLPGQAPLGLTDAFVRRYDLNGNELWTRQFGTANYDYIYGAVADSTGVYLLGNLGVAGPQIFPSGQPFLTKYDSSGNELWTTNLEVADARFIASDGTTVYVSGRMNWANNVYQPFLSKYDSSGSLMWTQLTNADFPSAMVANSAGVFLSVGGSLYEYDLNGNLMWTLKGTTSGPLALDATGFYGPGAYNAPGQCPSGDGDAVVARYDLDGTQIWLRQFEVGGSASAFAADSTGVYVAGPGGGTFLARMEGELVTPIAGKPQIRNECVVNAADFIGGGVTPGEMIAILGSGLGPAQPVSQNAPAGGRLSPMLAGSQVLFGGVPAPLMYVSDSQINGVAPAALSGATVDVQVEYNGVTSSALTVPVRGARFAVFKDQSGTIVLNADGTRNSQSNPAARGSVITVYGTGTAITNPSIADGQVLNTAAAGSLAATTTARFIMVDPDCNQTEEDSTATVQGVAGLVYGIFQVSMTVPADLSLDYPPEVYLDLGPGLGLVWLR